MMTIRPTCTSSSVLLLSLAAAALACLITPSNAFATLPSKVAILSPSKTIAQYYASTSSHKKIITTSSSPISSCLHLANNNNDEDDVQDSSASSSFSIGSGSIYTPLDRPLLAIVDTISLIIFAAIGKSSHSADGSLDLPSVLVTALPFVAAWLATSPVTGVYSPDDRTNDLVTSTALKAGRGWALAVPLGIALRGAMKGYVPPVPFVVVTLIATLVILAGVRILFSVAEDFFVELVN